MEKKRVSIIDRVAHDCAAKIVEAVEAHAEFYRGEPALLLQYNRDLFNRLSPAIEEVLSVKYGPEKIAAWKQYMARTGKGGI